MIQGGIDDRALDPFQDTSLVCYRVSDFAKVVPIAVRNGSSLALINAFCFRLVVLVVEKNHGVPHPRHVQIHVVPRLLRAKPTVLARCLFTRAVIPPNVHRKAPPFGVPNQKYSIGEEVLPGSALILWNPDMGINTPHPGVCDKP